MLTAGDLLTVRSNSEVDAYARAYADADGVGANGDANDAGSEGARVGQSGSETSIYIQGSAVLTSRVVTLHADTRVDAEAYSESDSDALGADSDARADVNVDGITKEKMDEAHTLDLSVQSKHGVKFIDYWYSEADRAIFCLYESPTKEAAAAVHREAHGGVADEIIEVKKGD